MHEHLEVHVYGFSFSFSYGDLQMISGSGFQNEASFFFVLSGIQALTSKYINRKARELEKHERT
jgi:hypothetical protein